MIVRAKNEQIRFVLIPLAGNLGIATGVENRAILQRG
jgi:hypothetical protein